MTSIENLAIELKSYFESLDYISKPSKGLISNKYPSEFNPSSGINYLLPFLKEKRPIEDPINYFVIDPCFRHLDMPIVSYSENHLSFFEMAGFIHCASLKKKAH